MFVGLIIAHKREFLLAYQKIEGLPYLKGKYRIKLSIQQINQGNNGKF